MKTLLFYPMSVARYYAGLLLVASSLVPCSGQGTITFDGLPLQPPGTSFTVQQYFESGVWFAPIAGSVGFGRRGSNPRDGWPDNGSAYAQAGLGDSLMFGLDDGSSFRLLSVDLAEFSILYAEAVMVRFTGYFADGSSVTTDLVTDGIIDGTGPLADFQTFYFGPEFSNLMRVEIPTFGWSLDNLVIAIPEPGSGALLLVGGLVCWALRRAVTPSWRKPPANAPAHSRAQGTVEVW